jgi:hypothetical protein
VNETPGVEVDAHPASRVHNSQPHGIGRVAALHGLGAWSNLGRNVVFAADDLRPRAVFDESVFSEDEPSQYDLDVHAVLDLPEADQVLVLNHFGMVRAFRGVDVRSPGSTRRVAPVWMRTFVADVERAVVVGGRLVGSQPREQRRSGLLVSEPVASATAASFDVAEALDSWGMVTALAPVAGGAAVGGDGHVSVVTMDRDANCAVAWEAAVDFEAAVIVSDAERLWVAGPARDPTVDDYDWEARHGGGFAALDASDGHVVVHGRFEHDLAWGNGGVAVVLAPGALCGLGRHGELHRFDRRDGRLVATTVPLADRSLGIAHAAVIGERIVYGFNRGGYRLWTAPVDPSRTA